MSALDDIVRVNIPLPPRGGGVTPTPPVPPDPWNPGDFTGIRLWLRSDTIVGTTNATEWTDGGPILNHATMATESLQPAITASWKNGKKALNTNGTRYLEGTMNVAGGTIPVYTVFFVGELPNFATSSNGGAFFCIRKSAAYTSHMHFTAGGLHYVLSDGQASEANVTQDPTLFSTYTTPFHETRIMNGDGELPSMWVNGSPTTLTPGGEQTISTGSMGYTLGINPQGSSQGWNGYMGELCVIDHAASLEERTLWNAYVVEYWGSF